MDKIAQQIEALKVNVKTQLIWLMKKYWKIYQLLIKFIPEDQPFPDEIEAISRGKREVEAREMENLEDIQWE